MQLVIDLSQAAGVTDMRPVRSSVMFAVARSFIHAFFDENPLSQLGIILLRNGIAEQLTELSSGPEMHVARLKGALDTSGSASLQNGIDLAIESLKGIPPYGYRESLILLASLSTCDPGNILDSIKVASSKKVRISVVGLSAEVHVCRTVADSTGGTYGIALNEEHLEELMLEHAVPPPAAPGSSGVSLVHMGFPSKAPDAPGSAAFVGADCVVQAGAYICPRCKGRTEELPSKCHICDLTLVLSSHLARSYHHLFPVKPFVELNREHVTQRLAASLEENGTSKTGKINLDSTDKIIKNDELRQLLDGVARCHGCSVVLKLSDQQTVTVAGRKQEDLVLDGDTSVVMCTECLQVFCYDCDVYIHEHLHGCPGCECSWAAREDC